jgi:uncharacterized protein YecE (DUF72 family)
MGDVQNTIHVGMGGWDLPPFAKYFYPPRPKKGFRKLRFYSQFFDFVEVNAPFYSTSLGAVHSRQWVDDVSDNRSFLFTIKLYRGFTHTFDATRADVVAVHRLLEPLAEQDRLRGLVIQFPYSFTNIKERRRYLMQLARAFQAYDLYLDVRHNSWNSPLMYNFFQENRFHLINVDLPPIKRHMPLTATAWNGSSYFRMMGRNSLGWDDRSGGDRYHYLYNDRELEHLLFLLERVRSLSRSNFVVFHNDPEANSLVNGFQLRHLLRKRHKVLVPQHLIQAHPSLKPISSPVNVLHPLFASDAEPIALLQEAAPSTRERYSVTS